MSESLKPSRYLFSRYREHAVRLAYRKLRWLTVWRERCERRLYGETRLELAADVVEEARKHEGPGFKISTRTLQIWDERHRKHGVEGLIDDRHVRRDGTRNTRRSADAVAFFHSIYRTESKHGAKRAHAATLWKAREQGWYWPESYQATTKWLHNYDDRSLTYLHRFGKDRWARKYLSHLEIDYRGIEPGALYVADHHQCDWWVFYKGRQIRPWLTSIQDCRSRSVVGWHLGPVPHQDAIIAAMRMAFTVWALPKTMRIDNGKDFTSKAITGLTKADVRALRREYGKDWQRIVRRDRDLIDCVDERWLGITGELDIALIFSIPYSPWSKGTLERWYGRCEDEHGKTYVTYCGNSAVNRPSCLEEIKRGYSQVQRRDLVKKHGKQWRRYAMLKLIDQGDIPTLEESREALAGYIEQYHLSPHRGLDGATPLAVWHTATSLRKADNDALLWLMETRGVYRVGANGVHFKIGPATIGYGKKSTLLKRYVGRDVLIRCNPEDISHCWAFTPDGNRSKPIARLESNDGIIPGTCTDDARDAIAEQMRERQVMHQAARSSAKRTRTAVAAINEHSRAKRTELRKTGTCDAVDFQPNIVPVQTGFEGASKAVRSGFDVPLYRPPDPAEYEDLFMDPVTQPGMEEEDEGMEALFIDDQPVTEDETLEDLL